MDARRQKKPIKNPPLLTEGFYKSWHRAIFPGSLPPSIVAAVRLYLRVRNGNGCVPDALAPRKVSGRSLCDSFKNHTACPENCTLRIEIIEISGYSLIPIKFMLLVKPSNY